MNDNDLKKLFAKTNNNTIIIYNIYNNNNTTVRKYGVLQAGPVNGSKGRGEETVKTERSSVFSGPFL